MEYAAWILLSQAGRRAYGTYKQNVDQPKQKSHKNIVMLLVFPWSVFSFSSDVTRKIIIKQSYSYAFLWAGNSIFVLIFG